MGAQDDMDMPSADVAVSRDEIDAQLALLFEHRLFKTSPALQRFLEYVVAEEYAGRGPEIKAYSIAISALERPDSFDPQSDPIVRDLESVVTLFGGAIKPASGAEGTFIPLL